MPRLNPFTLVRRSFSVPAVDEPNTSPVAASVPAARLSANSARRQAPALQAHLIGQLQHPGAGNAYPSIDEIREQIK